MNSIEEISRSHNEFIQVVKTFGGNIDPQDIVQEMYLRIDYHLKKHPNKEINFFYCWTTLRHIFFDMYKKDTKYCDMDIQDFHNIEATNDDIQEEEAYNLIEQKAKNIVNNLHYFDSKLFEIYSKEKTSIRKLADETNIGRRTIFDSLKKTKELIKEELKEDYEDYKNEDYELLKKYEIQKEQLTLDL